MVREAYRTRLSRMTSRTISRRALIDTALMTGITLGDTVRPEQWKIRHRMVKGASRPGLLRVARATFGQAAIVRIILAMAKLAIIIQSG